MADLRPYTDADVEALGRVAFPGLPPGVDPGQAERRTAAVLNWLAERGRLLPEPVETRTEWAVRRFEIEECDDEEDARKWYARCLARGDGHPTLLRRAVRTYPDGSTLYGPWVEVLNG